METKNLFEFATKELLQDAFLRYLFENYQSDDDELRQAGRKLLSEFSKKCMKDRNGQQFDKNLFEFEPDFITDVVTYAQAGDMDVVVDFKINGKDCILVIEDKTSTSVHDNQLKKYSDTLKKWNKGNKENRPTYKIYYKTEEVFEDEKKDCNNNGFVVFGIDDINQFFSKYRNASNLILRDYANRVSFLKNRQCVVSKKPIKDWDIEEWITFFNQKIRSNNKYNNSNSNNVRVWRYRGKIACLGYYLYVSKKHTIILEINTRGGNSLLFNVHIETKIDEKNVTWKRVNNDPIWDKVRDNLLSEFVKPKPHCKEEQIQTIQSLNKKIGNCKEAEELITKIIDDFINKYQNL